MKGQTGNMRYQLGPSAGNYLLTDTCSPQNKDMCLGYGSNSPMKIALSIFSQSQIEAERSVELISVRGPDHNNPSATKHSPSALVVDQSFRKHLAASTTYQQIGVGRCQWDKLKWVLYMSELLRMERVHATQTGLRMMKENWFS